MKHQPARGAHRVGALGSRAADAVGAGDVEALADYRRAPGMPYAHPTVDHFLPLFVTLGAAQDPGKPVDTVIDGYWMGFAKRSFQVR